jgi:AraC family transcriptional regulator
MYQLRAIQRALELVERELKEPLRLESLARRVGMSRWHFQRTFTAMVGEPAASYIRGRRLAEAGRCLRTSDRTILDVALEYRFESHEAFTRAFKSATAVTPSAWRRGPACAVAGLNRIFLTAEILNHRFRHMKLVPEIVTLPARTFIGLEAPFIVVLSPDANNLQVIPKLWDSFIARLRQGELQTNESDTSYGLCDRPESLGGKGSRPDEALYLAAVQVAPHATPPRGMTKWRSPAGTYAKFTHRGPVHTIGETMGFIYGKWFSESEYDRGTGPDLERMDARFNPVSAESILEIFIPLKSSGKADKPPDRS